MKYFIIAGLFIVSCGTTEDAVVTEDVQFRPPIVAAPAEAKEVEAKVIYRPFVNKAGKTIAGSGDYFLVYNDQEWFIKFSAGNLLRTEIEPLVGQTLRFVVVEHEGLWDSDSPEVQSRVGKFVGVYSIVK